MTTITLIKDTGTFVYDDYYYGRSALRIRELNDQNPAQNIKRSKSHQTVEAVLISANWYDTQIAAFTSVNAPSFKNNYELVADDYMGQNVSTMCNLIQSYPETTRLQRKVDDEGTTIYAFKAYTLVGTKEFYRDETIKPFLETKDKLVGDVKVGGDIRAYLVHPSYYQSLMQTPVATTYVGTGNGTLLAELCPAGAIAETITITATDATHFNVVGSVSGAIGVAVVGTTFVSLQIEVTLTAGTISFIAGDAFVVTSFAA